MDSLNIKVHIADRTYPLKVKPDEEEGIRNAAQLINDKMAELQKSYAASDKQDYLAMAALTFVIESERKLGSLLASPELLKRLEELDGVVAEQLAENS